MMDSIQLEIRKFLAPEYVFGLDARLKAGNYCKRFGGRRILLVTDHGVMQTPWVKDVERSIEELGMEYTVYSSVSPNPRDFEVMAGAEQYLHEKCNMLVAVGGGSAIDCAKGIGIVTTNHSNILAFEGVDKIDKPMPPLICIPTTGGTAADVSQFAIINNYKERYKLAIVSKAVVPDVALIDPLVLTSMDGFLTACTGMDALTHAMEAFVSNASSAFTDLYALESIRLINENLLLSYQNPNDLQFRGKMMLASLYAGLAFSNASLGCVHSLAHSLGGYLDLPHGECNAILLPHVVDYNFDVATDRYTHIADILGIDVHNRTGKAVRDQLKKYLMELNHRLGIFETLNNLGVQSDTIPFLSDRAIKDPCNATNPKPPEKRDLEVIYSEAM
ncbi:MAG: iron-containing alcohol dehydrogenase [Bacteroidales bacterium]|nr:iron-containing alcohol dehydrogenase [Bacteroidales bacterium]